MEQRPIVRIGRGSTWTSYTHLSVSPDLRGSDNGEALQPTGRDDSKRSSCIDQQGRARAALLGRIAPTRIDDRRARNKRDCAAATGVCGTGVWEYTTLRPRCTEGPPAASCHGTWVLFAKRALTRLEWAGGVVLLGHGVCHQQCENAKNSCFLRVHWGPSISSYSCVSIAVSFVSSGLHLARATRLTQSLPRKPSVVGLLPQFGQGVVLSTSSSCSSFLWNIALLGVETSCVGGLWGRTKQFGIDCSWLGLGGDHSGRDLPQVGLYDIGPLVAGRSGNMRGNLTVLQPAAPANTAGAMTHATLPDLIEQSSPPPWWTSAIRSERGKNRGYISPLL